MKSRYLLLIIFIAACILSCQKNAEDDTEGPTCRITSLKSYVNPDSLQTKLGYDASGRLINQQEYKNGTKSYEAQFTYSPTLITQKDYTGEGLLTNTTDFTIGANGYASFSTFGSNFTRDSVFYTYDSNGYLTNRREVYYMKINNVFKFDYSKTNTYTIANGNCVKEVEKWISPNNSSYNFEIETTYEYYTDKLNYTGMNGEYSFLGKNNTRLTKKATYVRSGDTITEEYDYLFNTEDKPTQANVKTTTKHGTETYNVKLAYACN